MNIKLREAIQDVVDQIEMEYGESLKTKIIKEFLSKPIRNCDVGTAEEQSDRFTKFCRLHEKGCGLGWGSKGIGNPKVTCPAYHNTECGLEWSQMPYEEVK